MFKKTTVVALLALFFSPLSHAQTGTPPVFSGVRLVGGGFLSAFNPDYRAPELYGLGGFLDLNARQHLGAEGEVRFLRLSETFGMHEDNYAVGLRYRWRFHRYEPYGKFLVGNGQFTFPSGYGHGGYLMLVPGGGLDVHWHRFAIRVIDYEFQHWINFQYNKLSPDGLSSGIGYRIF